MANIRINDLPLDAAPNAGDFAAIDGTSTRKTALTDLVNAGRPFASQAEAEAGTSPSKGMSPLTTAQAIAAIGGAVFAPSAAGLPTGGSVGQVLGKTGAGDYAVAWTNAGAGDLISVNNLADVANAATSLGNLGGLSATLAASTYLTQVAAASTYQPIGSYQPQASSLTSWAGVTRAAGFDTFASGPTSANLKALVTDETGSGPLVFATSPTLVTPALGTPSALVLTNATGLPIAGGGTGQATASAAFDALAPTTTRGDLIFRNATTNARLAASTAGYHLQTNGAGTDPTYAGFLQPGTGGTTRTWQKKGEDIFSVKDFGATGDGSTDDTAAINAALLAASVASPQRAVYFPSGTYKISSAITPPTGIRIYGENYANTTVRTTSATADVFSLTNPFVTIEEIQIASSVTRSAGSYFNINTTNINIRRFYMVGAFTGITLGASCSLINIENGEISATVASTGTSIVLNGGLAVYIRGVTATNSSGAKPFAHVLVNNGGDYNISDCGFILASHNMYVDPAAGQSVVTLRCNNVYFDQGGANGLIVTPSSTGAMFRCDFVQCWFTQCVAAGVNISSGGSTAADGIDFIDCYFFANGTGIGVSGANAKNVTIMGCQIAQNTVGVALATNSVGVRIIGNKIGAASGWTANTTGITISGSADKYVIVGNDFNGSTTAITGHTFDAARTVAYNIPQSVNDNGQIVGTATNDNASTGNVGQYTSSVVASGSAVGLTAATPANMTSISLTAGDWDVDVMFDFTGGATTGVNYLIGSVSLVSATLDATNGRTDASYHAGVAAFNLTPGGVITKQVNRRRLSLNATTTVYAVAQAGFGTSTCSVFGTLTARRVR